MLREIRQPFCAWNSFDSQLFVKFLLSQIEAGEIGEINPRFVFVEGSMLGAGFVTIMQNLKKATFARIKLGQLRSNPFRGHHFSHAVLIARVSSSSTFDGSGLRIRSIIAASFSSASRFSSA